MAQPNDIIAATITSVVLNEDDRNTTMTEIQKMIELVGAKTQAGLILRMHPDSYRKGWESNIALARLGVDSGISSRLECRCNPDQDENKLSVSTTPLTSDVYCIP